MTQTETSELPDGSLRSIRDPQRMYSADKLNLSQLSGERMKQLQPLRVNDTIDVLNRCRCLFRSSAGTGHKAIICIFFTNGYFEEDQVL